MKIKLESPPILRGSERQQISQLYSYLYRLAELLNISFEGINQSQSPQSALTSISPKALYNSIKKLICQSTELFDSIYSQMLPLLQELFPTIDIFRQLSQKLDSHRQELESSINSCQEEISQTKEEFRSALSNFVELENFTIRRWDEDYTELWASLDPSQTAHSLPISFSSARCIPAGSVSGSTLTVEEGLGQIYIIGKEIR